MTVWKEKQCSINQLPHHSLEQCMITFHSYWTTKESLYCDHWQCVGGACDHCWLLLLLPVVSVGGRRPLVSARHLTLLAAASAPAACGSSPHASAMLSLQIALPLPVGARHALPQLLGACIFHDYDNQTRSMRAISYEGRTYLKVTHMKKRISHAAKRKS